MIMSISIENALERVRSASYAPQHNMEFDGPILAELYMRLGLTRPKIDNTMVTSSNGNIFRVTDPFWGEFTSHRWIPLTKASDVELWCFLWSAPEQTGDLTIDKPVIWDAIALIMKSL